MSGYDDVWRILSTSSLSINSTGNASSGALTAQTYAVDVSFISAAGVGAYINIGSAALTASTTNAMLLPSNWVQRYKTTPGQFVAGQVVGSTAAVLYITQLTK